MASLFKFKTTFLHKKIKNIEGLRILLKQELPGVTTALFSTLFFNEFTIEHNSH